MKLLGDGGDLVAALDRIAKLEGVLRRVYANMPTRATESRKLIENALGFPGSPEPRTKRSARRRAGRDRR